MTRCMIVVAGGSGSRMGADIPKQFLMLRGKPLLMHTLENLHRMDTGMRLVLVLPVAHIPYWEERCAEHGHSVPHVTVAGGDTRFRSVQNGLSSATGCDLIGVHDGVRPFVSAEVVSSCFEAASRNGAAVPVTPIVQSLRRVEGSGSMAVDRNAYRAVQTPQCFRAALLRDAFARAQHDLYTDDAAVVEAIGHAITLVEGNVENIKVTTPLDMALAELMSK
jgi:2-C-methyl-D-erythritol 4-phosphate cytidylyltransferase